MSYLWSTHPWLTQSQLLRNQATFLELTDRLHSIIAEAEFRAWNDLGSHNSASTHGKLWQHKLANLMSDSEFSVVITMNYDTLLERLMMFMGYGKKLVYPTPLQRLSGIWDQYNFRTTDPMIENLGYMTPNLYKLHGSLSWYSLDLMDLSSPIYTVDMDMYYARISPEPYALEDDTLRAVIIPPVTDKYSLYQNRVLRAQWLGALNSLRKCEELYIIGYSLPKSDHAIRSFLSNACSNIKKIHVVNKDKSPSLLDDLKAIFPEDHIKFDYFGDDCVAHLTEVLYEEYERSREPYPHQP